jgi:hypothetical protein
MSLWLSWDSSDITFDSTGVTWDAGVTVGYVVFGFNTGANAPVQLANVTTSAFGFERRMFRSPYGSIWHTDGDGRAGIENITVTVFVIADDGISIAASEATALIALAEAATELQTQYGDFEIAALTSYSRVPVASGYRLELNFGTVDGLKTARALQGLLEFSKTWSPSETPNIFTELLPGSGVLPGSSLFPSFEPNKRVLYLAWYLGATEVGRLLFTNQSGANTDTIVTEWRLDFNDAVGSFTHLGWWGGDAATATVGTGVEIDKVAFAFKKTNSDRTVVRRTDFKW